MKKITLILSCFVFTISNAQNINTVETTSTAVINDTINGQIVEREIKTVTTKSQEVMLNPEDAGKLNQGIVKSPTKVTKTFYIDNDNDPFYDKVYKIKYYENNGKRYEFKSSDNGFSINTVDKANNSSDNGMATKSLSSPYYMIKTKGLNGIGYFDEKNNFMIEYFDENSKQLKVITFTEK